MLKPPLHQLTLTWRDTRSFIRRTPFTRIHLSYPLLTAGGNTRSQQINVYPRNPYWLKPHSSPDSLPITHSASNLLVDLQA